MMFARVLRVSGAAGPLFTASAARWRVWTEVATIVPASGVTDCSYSSAAPMALMRCSYRSR